MESSLQNRSDKRHYSLVVMNGIDSSKEPRRWTDAELHKLFSDYFDKLPGTCPVCGHEVRMMMDHNCDVAILSIRVPWVRKFIYGPQLIPQFSN
jgi:hypothetical protein